MNQTLGQQLASARQEKGLTTIEVAETTRFNLRFVKAAEEDRFDELPSTVFAVGFLRTYSALIDLDSDSIVDQYISLGIEQEDRAPELISMPLHKDPGESIKVILITLGLLFITGAVVVYSYFGNLEMLTLHKTIVEVKTTAPPKGRKTEEPTISDSLSEEEQTIADDDPVLENGKEEGAEEESAEKSSENTREIDLSPDPQSLDETSLPAVSDEVEVAKPPLRLKIVADSDAWIKATIDGGEPKETILKKGESVEWEADSGYLLSLGNVAGVHVFLDEEEVALTTPANNVIIDMKLPATPQ